MNAYQFVIGSKVYL